MKSLLYSQNGLHVSHLTLTYQTRERKEVTLDLQLNQELIPEGHFIHYQLPNGQGYAQKNFTLQDVDHCHYKVSVPVSNVLFVFGIEYRFGQFRRENRYRE